jgi:crotonobetainyl-CoA:carnitine CoA-transferase CaiB-like acyl-CoA transferase
VLELGGYIAAPFATLLLANLGAEVIKVESLTGDVARQRDTNFVPNNPGKRSVALDLKHQQARKVWNDLVSSADVIVHNMSDDAAAKLSITYSDCRLLQPQIVYCHIRSFGDGPYAGRGATNPIVESLSGLMSVTFRDGRPTRQGGPFYDQLAGALAALGTVAALALGDRSDGSGYVETELFETALYSTAARYASYVVSGELDGEVWASTPYGTFRARDGDWLYLGVINDGLWQAFCKALGLAEAAADSDLATGAQRLARRDYVNDLAQTALAQHPRDQLLRILREAGVPASPVNNFAQVLEDEHVRSPGKLFESSYRGCKLPLPVFPVLGSITQQLRNLSPPMTGEHSMTILRGLNYDEAEIAELIADGVIGVS